MSRGDNLAKYLSLSRELAQALSPGDGLNVPKKSEMISPIMQTVFKPLLA